MENLMLQGVCATVRRITFILLSRGCTTHIRWLIILNQCSTQNILLPYHVLSTITHGLNLYKSVPGHDRIRPFPFKSQKLYSWMNLLSVKPFEFCVAFQITIAVHWHNDAGSLLWRANAKVITFKLQSADMRTADVAVTATREKQHTWVVLLRGRQSRRRRGVRGTFMMMHDFTVVLAGICGHHF